jgi:hypothetical protein
MSWHLLSGISKEADANIEDMGKMCDVRLGGELPGTTSPGWKGVLGDRPAFYVWISVAWCVGRTYDLEKWSGHGYGACGAHGAHGRGSLQWWQWTLDMTIQEVGRGGKDAAYMANRREKGH